MHTTATEIVTKEQASFTELLDDREGIILDLENLHYYTLNATAVFLWKLMRSNVTHASLAAATAAATPVAAGFTPECLRDALAEAFSINVDLAELDTRVFLDELEGNGLISYVDSGARGFGARARLAPGACGELPAYEPPQLQLSNSLTQVTLSGSSTVAVAALATG
jgi:hypothetical protein